MCNLLRAAIVWQLMLLVGSTVCFAHGEMLIVTANPGKIMDGAKVLAEVPAGTRLWAFGENQGWREVKVPNSEARGWLLGNAATKIVLTDIQKAELKQANALYDKADAEGNAQQYAAARASLEQCLVMQRRLYGEHPDVAETLNSLGINARVMGDYAAARKYYDEALAIFRKVLGEQNSSTAQTLNNLGVLAYEQEDYSAARKYFEDALAIKRKLPDVPQISIADSFNNLGVLAMTQGDYPAARKYYEEALVIKRKELGDQDLSIAMTLNNLGILVSDQGDTDAARKYYEEALAIKRKVLGEKHTSTAMTLNNLGSLAHEQKDLPAARKYYEAALVIRRELLGNEHTSTAETINNLGVLAVAEQDYPAARKYYEEALAINRKVLGDQHASTADTLNNLGNLARTQGDLPVAADFYEKKRRITRRHVQRTLPCLSEAEQVKFLDNIYLKEWQRYLSFGWDYRETPALRAHATGWLINGKAVAHEALAARALLTRDEDNPQLAGLAKELAAVRQQLAGLANSIPQASEAEARQAKLTQLISDEQRLARSLAQATGETLSERDWYELDEIRAAIPDDAVYIDLVRMGLYDFENEKSSPPHYFAWVIPAKDRGEIQIIDLGEAATIEAAVEQARTTLAATKVEESLLHKQGEAAAQQQVTAVLQAAADLVLKPLLPQLAGKKQLILSPDGTLWLLPWAALPAEKDKALLEKLAVRYVTSGRDLLKKSGTSKLGVNAPAIFANPNYNLDAQVAKAVVTTILPHYKIDADTTRGIVSQSSLPQVAALPSTELEALTAQPMLAKLTGSNPDMYLEGRCLETVAKQLKRPKYLLLSTHGFFLPDQEQKESEEQKAASVENPLLRCGLLLAGCNAARKQALDDGILTGLEIVGMDLRGTELVVLSACETGVGKVRNGEGVAGLRQAFQLAGAESVVSTLWQVPDRDSALIMQDFFTNLAAGQSKADALRNAQLKRIAARKEKSGAAHPFFWAAWTVTGE